MKHVKLCYAHEIQDNKHHCCSLGEDCDPRPCGNCP